MDTGFFYFSATGNCLAATKKISERIDGRIVSIPDVVNNAKIKIKEDRVIVVFPAYLAPLCGVPLIVERFIGRIENIESKYIIAICTCGGYEVVNAIPPLKKLKKIIKSCGGRLAEEYSVRLPMSNLDYDHIPVPIEKSTVIILSNGSRKIESICERILSGKGTKNRILKSMFYFLIKPMNGLLKEPCLKALREHAKEEDKKLTYKELIPLSDRSIHVNENCNGCGICSKVCPVGNIEIMDNKPVWKHTCEMCFACDEWCPQKAIQHWSRKKEIKYHHPEIKIKEMYVENRENSD
jgi:ferredoxin